MLCFRSSYVDNITGTLYIVYYDNTLTHIIMSMVEHRLYLGRRKGGMFLNILLYKLNTVEPL